MTLSAPEPIGPNHDCSAFDCGKDVLSNWLRQRALRNEANGASRTYVVTDGIRVVAYYCLSNGAVAVKSAPGKVRRNMPDPIPVMLMGRLAVDTGWQGQSLGKALLRDAILRTLKAAGIAGIRALMVHALDEEAVRFYAKYGFTASPGDGRLLILPLETARRALG